MIPRSVAASWTFYSPSNPMAVYQIKPYFSLDNEGLRLHPVPEPLTPETIAAHHVGDYFMRQVVTEVTFPYTLTAARMLFRRLFDDQLRRRENYLDSAHPSGSGILARRLIDRFAQTTHRRGARLVVVLIPHPGRPLLDNARESQFADDLRLLADTCVVNLRPFLRDAARPLLPSAPHGHYTAWGNQLIANAVTAALRTCDIRP